MRILVGYDGSSGAKAAVADLVRAGLPVEAEVLVLSVADVVAPAGSGGDVPVPAPIARSEYQSALDQAAAWADEGRALVLDAEPSWRVEKESRADSPAWTILQRAKTWTADLVVVGADGRSKFARGLFGSVAERLVHEIPCNVRVGRGRPPQDRPGGERLVVGVDGSPGAEAAVDAILARRWAPGSAVRVVTAVNPAAASAFTWFGAEHETPLAWLRTLNEVAVERLSAAGLDAARIVANGESNRVLLEEASSWGADCVFVGAHGWHGSERSLLGGVPAAIAARAVCSVEIVPPAPG
jgi:nucleotide-binding universal stress UspA family protein